MIGSRLRVASVLLMLAALSSIPASLVTLESAIAQEEVPSVADAMPQEVLAYVEIDIDPLGEQFVLSQELLLRAAVPGDSAILDGLSLAASNLVSLIPSDLRTLLDGEAAVALSDFGEFDVGSIVASGGDVPAVLEQTLVPGFVLVLRAAQAGNVRGEIERFFRQQSENAGVDIEVFQSGDILILRNPDPSTSSVPGLPSVVVFAGDFVLLGASFNDVAPFVEAAAGEAPSLSELAEFDQLTAALPAEHILFGYANGPLLVEQFNDLVAVAGTFPGVPAVPMSLASSVNLSAFTISADDPGFRFEFAALPADFETESLVAISSLPDFASQIPATSMLMVAGQDFGKSWFVDQFEQVVVGAIAASLIGASPEPIDIEQGRLALELLLGFNLRTDFFDQMQGDYGAALFSLDISNPAIGSAVAVTEVDDPNRVSDALNAIGPIIQAAGAGQAVVTTVQIDDATLSQITVETGGVDLSVQYGVLDQSFVIGIGGGIEAFLTQPGASLSDDADYRTALAALPSNYDAVYYLNPQAIGELVLPSILSAISMSSQSGGLVDSLCNGMTGNGPAADLSEAACKWITSGLTESPGALVDAVGPFVAVSYDEDDLWRISGVLLIDGG